MAAPPPADIRDILAALSEFLTVMIGNQLMIVAAGSGGTPAQIPPQPPGSAVYPNSYPVPTPPNPAPYALPQPVSTGSVDLSNIRPIHSGSVSLNEATENSRGYSNGKGFAYEDVRNGELGLKLHRNVLRRLLCQGPIMREILAIDSRDQDRGQGLHSAEAAIPFATTTTLISMSVVRSSDI